MNVGNIITGAWSDFLEHADTLLKAFFVYVFTTILVVTVALVGAAVFIGFNLDRLGDASALSWGLLTKNLVVVLVCYALVSGYMALTTLGWVSISLKIQRGEQPVIRDLFSQWDRLMPGWIALFTLGLISSSLTGAVGAIDVVGEPLAMVVGLLVSAATCLTMFFVVDGKPGFTAIKKSLQASQGNIFSLAVICFFTTALGWTLIAGPIGTLALSRAYVGCQEL